MKIKYVIILGIIVILAIGGFYLMKSIKKGNNEEEKYDFSKIKSFYITYTNGYAMNSYTTYQLSVNNNKYMVKIKPYGIPEEELLEIEVDRKVVDKLIEILTKYEVNKWDGFDRVAKDVLDGNSFSLSITLEDEKTIDASGYMIWPDHYRDVINEISPIFMEIYNKEKGIKEDE